MTDLFKRHSTVPFAGTVHTSKTGKPYTVQKRTCGRCGGAGGAEAWKFTGWKCYDCGGAGHLGDEAVKLYTAEQIAAMNGRAEIARAKRQAKADAKAAEIAAEVEARRQDFLAVHGALLARADPYREADSFIADVYGKAMSNARLSPAQAEALQNAINRIEERTAKRAASRHVGELGARIETAVTVERVYRMEVPAFNAPWRNDTLHIVTMRDAAGNAIVSKSTSFSAEKDDQFLIRATVKDHSEYNGEKQTLVARVTIKQQKGATV